MDRVLTRFFGHHGRDRVIHTDARCAVLRVVREHTARLRAIRAITDNGMAARDTCRFLCRVLYCGYSGNGDEGGLAHRK